MLSLAYRIILNWIELNRLQRDQRAFKLKVQDEPKFKKIDLDLIGN